MVIFAGSPALFRLNKIFRDNTAVNISRYASISWASFAKDAREEVITCFRCLLNTCKSAVSGNNVGLFHFLWFSSSLEALLISSFQLSFIRSMKSSHSRFNTLLRPSIALRRNSFAHLVKLCPSLMPTDGFEIVSVKSSHPHKSVTAWIKNLNLCGAIQSSIRVTFSQHCLTSSTNLPSSLSLLHT